MKKKRVTNKRATKEVLGIDTTVIEEGDSRVHICSYCNKPVLLANGYWGYTCYTMRSYGKKWISTLTAKHYGGKNNKCMKKWLGEQGVVY
jgi:hypothetical protein